MVQSVSGGRPSSIQSEGPQRWEIMKRVWGVSIRNTLQVHVAKNGKRLGTYMRLRQNPPRGLSPLNAPLLLIPD